MPKYLVHWRWEEAFDKFGFNDGEGLIFTEDIASHLEELGFKIKTENWSLHNIVISSIKKDGVEKIPEDVNLGYDCPHTYLPRKIINALDKAFPEDKEL